MNSILTTRMGIKEALPTAFGYFGIGIAFGIVSDAAGFSPLITILMSVMMYAGSGQFVAIAMLATQSPILSIIFAVFLVNSRMLLMSLTLAPYFRQTPWYENLLIGAFLTDESFALGMNKTNYTKKRQLNFQWYLGANLVPYFFWIISTSVGVLLGKYLAHPEKFGLDFAIVAMFIGLIYFQVAADQTLTRKLQLTMIIISIGLVYIGLIFIPGNLLVLLATLVGCGIGVVIKHVYY